MSQPKPTSALREHAQLAGSSLAIVGSTVYFVGKLAVAGALNVVVYLAVGAFLVAMAALALPLAALLRGGDDVDADAKPA